MYFVEVKNGKTSILREYDNEEVKTIREFENCRVTQTCPTKIVVGCLEYVIFWDRVIVMKDGRQIEEFSIYE